MKKDKLPVYLLLGLILVLIFELLVILDENNHGLIKKTE